MFGYCLIIYLSKDNKTIVRINKSEMSKKIGQRTSMGWIVLDKQYYAEELKMFVGEKTMRELMLKRRKKVKKENRIKNFLYKILE